MFLCFPLRMHVCVCASVIVCVSAVVCVGANGAYCM